MTENLRTRESIKFIIINLAIYIYFCRNNGNDCAKYYSHARKASIELFTVATRGQRYRGRGKALLYPVDKNQRVTTIDKLQCSKTLHCWINSKFDTSIIFFFFFVILRYFIETKIFIRTCVNEQTVYFISILSRVCDK